MQAVVHSLEQTVSKIHIANWVYVLEVDASWKLSIGMSPLVLNTLHMPLVYNDNNPFSITFIYLLEEILVSLVNENVLKLWEEDVCVLNEPVDLIRVKALFGKLRCF